MDPRVGPFLRRLTRLKASRGAHQLAALPSRPPNARRRVHLTTGQRLHYRRAARIVATVGMPLPGCFPLFLVGLADADAVGLWKRFGVSGSERELAGAVLAPSTTTRC